MTLSASAIINGLAMLRAYGAIECVRIGDEATDAAGKICVYVNEHADGLHADDVRRLESEGWVWTAEDERWEL